MLHLRVGHKDKIRQIDKVPCTFDSFRIEASRRLAEFDIFDVTSANQPKFSQLSSPKVMQQFVESMAAQSEQPLINWDNSTVVYCDSEDDLITVSDEEDFTDCLRYNDEKGQPAELLIVDREDLL